MSSPTPPSSAEPYDFCRPDSAARLVLDLSPEAPLGYSRLRCTANPLPAGSGCSAAGLGRLQASGSSQFSQSGLQALRSGLQQAGHLLPQQPLCIVDLRREPHGFAGGVPLSWYGFRNGQNRQCSAAAAAADEAGRLRQLAQQTGQTIGLARLCKWRQAAQVQAYFVPERLHLGPVCSEAALLRRLRLTYCRLPMADHTGAPDAATVSRFERLLRCRRGWLHLHCRKGMGRTSLFLVMLDIFYNARSHSLASIVSRQHALGSGDLRATSRTDPDKSRQRQAFLAAYHRRHAAAADSPSATAPPAPPTGGDTGATGAADWRR